MNAISAIISFIFLAIMLFIIIVVTGMILTGKALVNSISSVIPGAVIKDTVDDIISGEIFKGKTDVGGSCKLDTDCKGWGIETNAIACCKGKCTKKLKQWDGVGYCPDACRDAPWPLGKLGSCDSGNTWPRSEDQPCDNHSDCKGWVAGKIGTLGCCKGKCTKLIKSFDGFGWCPHECKAGAFEKPGTCGKNCKTYLQGCSKSTQCCSGKCNLLNGVAKNIACPCDYVDHGSYACCKFCAGGKEDKNNCPKFSCGA